MQIDSGVTEVLADTTTFVARMIGEAGTPAGAFAANQDFYATEHGKIAALEARAEANRVLGLCPSTALVSEALAAAKAQGAAGRFHRSDSQG